MGSDDWQMQEPELRAQTNELDYASIQKNSSA
jgi:hypothetical protein